MSRIIVLDLRGGESVSMKDVDDRVKVFSIIADRKFFVDAERGRENRVW